jgi:GT2 family glycosyltransferase
MIKFSIIIPVVAINEYIRETVPYIQSLDGGGWELIILPNESDANEWHHEHIQIIASGKVGPAIKRDLGAKAAKGEILIFLDDDSYPNLNLLKIAAPFFLDNYVIAIGGPAITPKSDSFWQKVSGAVFLSKFSGGNPERYISVGEVKEIDDWPSVNFMVRRDIFLSIGGFNSLYWPGEDTWLCMELIKKTNKKILYVPNLIVWHHRRSGLMKHLNQIGGYGLHRGYFAKKYKGNSLKFMYFVPSFMLIWLVLSTVNIFLIMSITLNFINAGILFLYFSALGLAVNDIKKIEGWQIAIATIPFIVLTHITYGYKFIIGLTTMDLKSRLRKVHSQSN